MLLLFAFSFILIPNLCSSAVNVYYSINTSGHVEGHSSHTLAFANSSIVAQVRYTNRINQTGWAELDLETNAHHPDNVQAYYAGYLEGYLTAQLIDSFRKNMDIGNHGDRNGTSCHNVSHFIEDNLNYTIGNILHHNVHSSDIYWKQVALVLYQLAGLDDGYLASKGKSNTKTPHLNLDPCGSILLNLIAEIDDLINIINGTTNARKDQPDHCSALVKLIPDSGDVLVAHNTWITYSAMLRILKKYSLNYQTSKAKSISMSSYPGLVISLDDFYITSTRLVVQETSIANYDDQQWNHLGARTMIFEFIRNTVANRLAQSGSEWAQLFSQHNSGTYNNQFMIVDYNKLNGTTLHNGFLTILEQLLHYIRYEDKTEHLRNHTYWASYNVPYFKQVYHQSGYEDKYHKYDDYYSYEKTARAQMFKRDHFKVHNLTTLYHLMRYNDFANDPLSSCANCTPTQNGVLAISARADLNDPNGKYPITGLRQNLLGAIDAKLTSSKLVNNLEMIAVSGPTDQQEEFFDWTKVDTKKYTNVFHLEQPNVWKFKPVLTEWQKADGGFVDFELNL